MRLSVKGQEKRCFELEGVSSPNLYIVPLMPIE